MKNFTDTKFCIDTRNKFSGEKLKFLDNFIISNIMPLPKGIRQKRMLECIRDILLVNDSNWENLFLEYKRVTNTIRKLEIRYGKERAQSTSEAFSKTAKKHLNETWFRVDFWTKRGYTEDEARNIISQKQSNLSRRFHDKMKSQNISYRELNSSCSEYWIRRGYTEEEAAKFIKVEKDKGRQTLDKFKNIYGEEEGTLRFNNKNIKRLETLYSRYGNFSVSPGKISKSSIKVFKKLYKRLRRLGIAKDEFNWGIQGSSEFVRTDTQNKKTYFYDFVVRSSKLVVEYNGLYWHPRHDIEWRGPGDYNEKISYDKRKIEFIENLGFKVFVVWEDDDAEKRIEEIADYVKTTLDV